MPIKQLIPFEAKVKAKLALRNVKGIDPEFSFLKTLQGPKAFIFLAADYGNLGDVAITFAETQFLKKHLPDFHIVDLPISKTIEAIHAVKKIIQPEDIVTTVGGGNFGDRYHQIEYLRRLIIKSFQKNRIVAFPQTIEFSNTPHGKAELLKAQKIYQAHPNLILAAREQKSFEEMTQFFPKNKVVLSPDIVMSLDQRTPYEERKGVVLCLRNDDEKKLAPDEEKKILEQVSNSFSNQKIYDTHIGRDKLSLPERQSELSAIWSAFRGAELVVTDRLHGMIFCYITSTPCLVFQNSNHKILSSFEWLKFSNRIKILEEVTPENVKNAISDLKTGSNSDPYQDLSNRYANFIEAFNLNQPV